MSPTFEIVGKNIMKVHDASGEPYYELVLSVVSRDGDMEDLDVLTEKIVELIGYQK